MNRPSETGTAGPLQVRTGDLFVSDAHTLVNPVNCVGVMGAGLAAEFRRRFPDLDADYRRRCAAGQLRLGQPYLYRTSAGVQVINFPTKGHWRQPSRLTDLDQGLAWLAAHADQWQLGSLAVPALGAGHGGLSWEQVGPLLYRHLHQLGVPVMLYAPPGTPAERATLAYLTRQQPDLAGELEELQAAAVGYARRGIAVLPLHHPIQPSRAGASALGCSCRAAGCGQIAKHPLATLVPHGVKDASCDPAVVAGWWRRFPQANIGLACGHAFDVLDVDRPAGERAIRALAAEYGLVSSGPLVRTGGGGWHYYLRPTGLGNARPRDLEHVDWRGRGGYVVAPPSRHASGHPYRWLPGRDLQVPPGEVPAVLWERLQARRPPQRPAGPVERLEVGDGPGGRYARAALATELARVASAPIGQRNHQLWESTRNLYNLVATGALQEREVHQGLLGAAERSGLLAEEPRQTRRTLASGRQVGLDHPRRPPQPTSPERTAVSSALPWRAAGEPAKERG